MKTAEEIEAHIKVTMEKARSVRAHYYASGNLGTDYFYGAEAACLSLLDFINGIDPNMFAQTKIHDNLITWPSEKSSIE